MADSIGTPAGEGGGQGRGDLLIVDNDSKIVELLTWFLCHQGYMVRTAASFVEARERLAERRPDLLISDVDLGVESATSELPKLSAEGVLPPTLVVSGFLDENVRQSIFRVPEVLDTLPKPFEFPDLEAKVAACLAASLVVPAPRPPSLAVDADTGAGTDDDDDDDDDWIEISPGVDCAP